MSWQLQLGIDIDLLKKSDPVVRDRQIWMLSLLSVMLIVIGLICTASTILYVLIVFHNWPIAICAGVFIGLVAFNLYRLLVMTAMDGSGTVLGDYMSDHEKHIFEQIDHNADLSNWPEERILEFSARAKQQLREKPLMDKLKSGMNASSVLTMTIRVLMLSVMALIFATGIEIYIFKDQINSVMSHLKEAYQETGDIWMVNNILSPEEGDDFYIIQSNSLLLVLEVLSEGLGYWKLLLDILFMILFLIPLAIVFRSKEISKGEYIKEWVLSSVTISLYHYLSSRKYCQQLIASFKQNTPGRFYQETSVKES
jgi:hypothetical protein